ncbi:MAG TPA: carbon-nitrogen family hydrolase [Chloroflexota bacterium]|nr:carbon-nitrogen family hydrolase [Chloroflexota bacterium]
MTRTITISVAQMPVVGNDPDSNLETAARAVGEAARRGSDLVILPELWTSGIALREATSQRAIDAFDAVGAMRGMAHTDRIAVAGSMLLRDGDHYHNVLLLVDAAGEILGRYEKIHPFTPMDEHLYVAPGDDVVSCDTPWGRIGLAVCYDLRFPELFRRLTDAGAELIILPAEWPHPRLEHWKTLTRARAIENQCFFVAANAAGTQGRYHFCGHSAVIDPWGQSVAEAGEEATVLTATVDLDEVAATRERFPALKDRRLRL